MGDGNLYEFALSVSSAIIILAIAIIGWFIRDKMRQRENEGNLLTKRLEAGTERMKELGEDIREVETNVRSVEYLVRQFKDNTVTIPEHKACQERHDSEHDRFAAELKKLSDGQNETRELVAVIGAKLDTGFSTVGKMLQGKIVDNPKQET